MIQLRRTTSTAVMQAIKAIFSRHGVPETLLGDNGPQYSSHEFAEFAKAYEFNYITSSPRFPQSNGQAERAVKTAKQLIQKSKDPFMALLSYRTTPLPWCNLFPAELCMSKRLRPQVDKSLVPEWNYVNNFRQIKGVNKKKVLAKA